MSHNIYKKIKLNDDLSFDFVVAASNLFDYYNRYIFRPYHCDWFKDEYPTANKETVRVIFAMFAGYAGDVIYVSSYKKLVDDVWRYISKNDISYYNLSPDERFELAEEIVKYLKDERKTLAKYVVKFNKSLNGTYVLKQSSRRVWMTDMLSKAKVYKDSLESLKAKFQGYDSYDPEFIKI